MQVCVIGAGAWGTAVAAVAATNGPVTLWAREPEVVASISERRENALFLPDVTLPDRLAVTHDLEGTLASADLVVVGVPSRFLSEVLEPASGSVATSATVLSLTKGIEAGTGRRMSEVIAATLPAVAPSAIGVLAGPNLAREVTAGHPAATCVAFPDEAVAGRVQERLGTDRFRVYTSTDVVGCELAGAFKNVVAIAAGMADGLGYGMNTKAALVSRGLAELARLGLAMGGDPLTFLGLAGAGDLMATCASPLSRNRDLGEHLIGGASVDELQDHKATAAEGADSAEPILLLGARYGVELPICDAVGAVLAGRCQPVDALEQLMGRPPTQERHGLTPPG